jgi:tRNA threonylcarbamoyl adenosine modification protein YeaZ
MLILAVDTTSDKGGVGIFCDAECLASVPNEEPMNRYSVSLFEMVQQALARARLEPHQIDLYAAATGPGSFTGIRVGLAATQAWAKAFECRGRGVSVLEAMVNKACQRAYQEPLLSPGEEGTPRARAGEGLLPSQGSPQPDWFFPILDARRGEFYLGNFHRKPSESPDAERDHYEPADAGWVLNPERLRAFLDERVASGASATCLVRAHDQAAIDLCATLPAAINCQPIEGTLMDSIARIAQREENSGRPRPDATLDAYYIRRPDAEIKS